MNRVVTQPLEGSLMKGESSIPTRGRLGGWGVKVPPLGTGSGVVNLEQEEVSAILAEETRGQSHQDEKLPAARGE